MTDSQKSRARAAFPTCTAVADEFRAVFGEGVRLTYAEENGNRAGRALDESRFTVIAGESLIIAKPKKEGDRG
jgi:hypothetical protein